MGNYNCRHGFQSEQHMRVQTVNAHSSGIGAKVFLKKTSALAAAFISLFLAACIPVGDQTVNTELFKSKEDMKERTADLKPGMSKKAVFEKIRIDQEKFTHMGRQEVQMNIYGNSQVQGTPEQLEAFRQKLADYDGYSLPYRDIKSSGSFGFGSLRVNKNGYDLKLVLIFDRGKLLRASIDGNHEVNMNEDESIFNVALKRATGVGF
jgi:hypothetical protein